MIFFTPKKTVYQVIWASQSLSFSEQAIKKYVMLRKKYQLNFKKSISQNLKIHL